MANKVKVDNIINRYDKEPKMVKEKSGSKLKIILIMMILLIIAVAGFAVGIYLKIIDMQGLADKWNLNEKPVIGQYFSPPKTNFETVELEQQSSIVAPTKPAVAPIVQPETMLPAVRKIDDVEFQKQLKIKQLEETKRISKVARLYGAMKPAESVVILNSLDDETVLLILNKMEDEPVAKIMALFDARRAAALSQSMLRGRSIN